ncbi:hypothetical protein OG302_42545 [Streptomyces sp. NBC_01283]|uniref:hypothetical protein n=1 Tax=Streptomyces sp. NBC_01283 TaxID=2903812 RepID=UPI00352EF4E8|nr:hypothetical protein OG302_42545 [Streptomyces sp. NBC_01283]
MTTYDAAFSAPAVQSPWDSGGPYPPSLYCISGNSYDRYSWTGTNRPMFGDTPDSPRGTLLGNKTPGGQTTNGLLGHWNPWTSVDAALCVDVNNVFLFKGNECIILPLNEAGNYKDTDPTPETHTAVTDPVPIASQFGYTGTQDTATFPLTKVDAAFLTAGGTNIWFFGGDQCYCIDALTHTPIDHFSSGGAPITLPIRQQWQNLPDDLKNGLTWAAPTLNSDGVVQDSAHLVTDTTWCPVIPSTQKSFPYITDPNEPPINIPDNVEQITLELWGPGGNGSSSANGGAGAYIAQIISHAPTGSVNIHLGTPGDYTSYPAQSPTHIAGGGGGAGGSGANGASGRGGGRGGSGGGGSGGKGEDGNSFGGPGGDTSTHESGTGGDGDGGFGGRAGSAGQAGGPGGFGSRGGAGGGGGGGGGRGVGGFGGGGTGGRDGGSGGGGGGGGAQGPSLYPSGARCEPCADRNPSTPFMSLDGKAGFGGTPSKPSGGNGAARISW